MKKLLLSVAVLALATSSALAADMRYPAPRGPAPAYAPPPPPAFSWSGFYIGAQGGYAWGRSDESFVARTNSAAFQGTQSYDIDGGVAGGVIGYNWAMGGSFSGSRERSTGPTSKEARQQSIWALATLTTRE